MYAHHHILDNPSHTEPINFDFTRASRPMEVGERIGPQGLDLDMIS